MHKTARLRLASAVALGCIALAAATSCGGSGGERPSPYASGGVGGGASGGGSGGTINGGATGSGGTTSTGLDCANAIEPDNGGIGGVTDFSDWVSSKGKWGSPDGLFGATYGYKDAMGSTMTVTVDTTNTALHATGAVVDNGYGGVGLGFWACTTVASFTHMEFDVMGSSAGCDLELQIKTYDQQPTSDSPAGGCDASATSCYQFPSKKQVVDLTTPVDAFTTVTVPLADLASWSDDAARQVVGLQWQWTGTNVELDAATGCPIDVMITNVRFRP